MRISVVGLGKLGSPMVASFGNGGHTVIGVDVNPVNVEKINNRIAPVDEPGLGEALRHRVPGIRWTARISATTDLARAVKETDITFIIVPTPSDKDGGFSLDYILPSCRIIAEAIKRKNRYHVVVITSTVMPGSTDGPIRKIFEESGLKRNSYGLAYSPEFIALGTVIRDFENPDVLLIGAEDPEAEMQIKNCYSGVIKSDPYIAVMTPTEAEITKLALNTYVTTKISYANMLTRICEKMPGTNVDKITAAIGADSRVGSKYLKGGLPFGGPCFPRDNRALAAFMKTLGIIPLLPSATDLVNKEQIWNLINHSEDGDRALILGTSYKMGTNLKEQSAGTLLQEQLVSFGHEVHTWDPELGISVLFKDLIERATIIYIMHPFSELNEIDPSIFSNKKVVDCWRAFPQFDRLDINYIGLGIGREQ